MPPVKYKQCPSCDGGMEETCEGVGSVTALKPLAIRAALPILDKRDYIARQRAYIRAIQPYLDMKYRVYSVTMPKIIIHVDGRIEHEYDFTDDQKTQLALADEIIEEIKKSFTAKGSE